MSRQLQSPRSTQVQNHFKVPSLLNVPDLLRCQIRAMSKVQDSLKLPDPALKDLDSAPEVLRLHRQSPTLQRNA